MHSVLSVSNYDLFVLVIVDVEVIVKSWYFLSMQRCSLLTMLSYFSSVVCICVPKFCIILSFSTSGVSARLNYNRFLKFTIEKINDSKSHIMR